MHTNTQNALQDMTNEDQATVAGGDGLLGEISAFVGAVAGNAVLAARADWYLITNRPFIYVDGQLKT